MGMTILVSFLRTKVNPLKKQKKQKKSKCQKLSIINTDNLTGWK